MSVFLNLNGDIFTCGFGNQDISSPSQLEMFNNFKAEISGISVGNN